LQKIAVLVRFSDSEIVSEMSEAVSDISEVIGEMSEVVSETPEIISDISKSSLDVSEAASEMPEVITGMSEAVWDISDLNGDVAQRGEAMPRPDAFPKNCSGRREEAVTYLSPFPPPYLGGYGNFPSSLRRCFQLFRFRALHCHSRADVRAAR
jgi:hypothetical protein